MRINAKLHTENERRHADFHATVQVGGGFSLGHALMWDMSSFSHNFTLLSQIIIASNGNNCYDRNNDL